MGREVKFKMRFQEEKESAMLRVGRKVFQAEGTACVKASRWERVWHVPETKKKIGLTSGRVL